MNPKQPVLWISKLYIIPLKYTWQISIEEYHMQIIIEFEGNQRIPYQFENKLHYDVLKA